MTRHAAYPDGADEADIAFLDSLPLPEGSFVEGFTTVVSFVRADGANAWYVYNNQGLPATQVIGLLEVAKIELIARTPGLVTTLSPEDDDG